MGIYNYKGIRPRIADSAWVAPDASVIGDVELGEDSSVWFGCVLRGDVCNISVGARSNVQDLSVFHVNSDGTPTVIGEDVTVGHAAVVHAATVKPGALIGIGSVVLDGAVIGEGAVVGARALVTPGTKVPPWTVVMGSPAKVVREVSDKERKWQADTVARYVALSREYKKSVS